MKIGVLKLVSVYVSSISLYRLTGVKKRSWFCISFFLFSFFIFVGMEKENFVPRRSKFIMLLARNIYMGKRR